MANMVDVSALEAAGLAEKLNKDDNLWWVVVNVDASEAGAKPKAVVGATGNTNLAGLKAQLREDAMQFGCFKVLGVDTKGAVTSTRLKLVTFQCVCSAGPPRANACAPARRAPRAARRAAIAPPPRQRRCRRRPAPQTAP